MASDSLTFLVPPPGGIAGDLVQVRRWAEARTGWATDAAGTVARLQPAEWNRRRQELPAGIEEPADCSSQEAAEGDRHLAIAFTSVISRDDYAALWHLDRALAGGSDVPTYWFGSAS
jgi:hypothetical protein